MGLLLIYRVIFFKDLYITILKMVKVLKLIIREIAI